MPPGCFVLRFSLRLAAAGEEAAGFNGEVDRHEETGDRIKRKVLDSG